MKNLIALAAVVSISLAASAQAAFVFSATRTDNALTVGGKSYDRIVFKVLNDGEGGLDHNGNYHPSTGTKVVAMESNIVSDKPMRFYEKDTNEDDLLDVDLTGAPGNINTTQYVKYNPTLYQFLIINNGIPAPWPISSESYDAPAAYATTLTLAQFTGATLGPANAPVANVTPYSFLTVIVEAGATVRTHGLIGGEIGGAQGLGIGGQEAQVNFPMDITSAVPEPTTLGLLAGAAVTGLRRRR